MLIHHLSKSRITLLTSALLLTSSGVLGEGATEKAPVVESPVSESISSGNKGKVLDLLSDKGKNEVAISDSTVEGGASAKINEGYKDKEEAKDKKEPELTAEISKDSVSITDETKEETKKDSLENPLELTMQDVLTKSLPSGASDGSPMSHMAPLGVSDDETNLENILSDIFSREKPSKNDSIQAAMISAYQTNPDIREKRSALRAADEQIVQAKAGWRPKVDGSVNGSLRRTNLSGDTVNITTADAFLTPNSTGALHVKKEGLKTASIQASQNLYKGGQTLYATREAKANIKSARATLAFAEQGVFQQSTQAYLKLLTKYVELELLRRNEDSLKKTLDVTLAKFEVGEETRTSVAQAEGEYAQAVAQRYTAEAELEGNKAVFERVTNRKAGKLTKPELPKAMPVSLDVVLERLRINNPEIIAAQYDEKAARHTVDKIQSGMFPELNLVGSSSAQLDRNKVRYTPGFVNPGTANRWLNDKTVTHEVALQLKVPIYEQGLIRSQTRGAAETAEQKRINIEIVRRRIVQEAIKAWNDFIQAKESVEYYKVQVKARVASLEGVRQEYAVGSKILLDVLNEMTRLIRAQLELVRNQEVYYDAAYRIFYYMGDLNARALKLNVDLYDSTAHYEEVKDKL